MSESSLVLSRRGLIAAGLTGSATLLATPFSARSQAPGGGPTGGRSAVIDVNRARTDPIPVAVLDFAAAGGGKQPAGEQHRPGD